MMPCPVPDVHVCKYARRIYVIIYLEMDKKRNITHNLPHRQRRNKLANKSESSPSRGDATQRICTRVARLLFAVCMFLCIFRVRREPLLLWFGYWMRKHEKSLRKKVTSKILWHKSVLWSVFGGIVACLVWTDWDRCPSGSWWRHNKLDFPRNYLISNWNSWRWKISIGFPPGTRSIEHADS